MKARYRVSGEPHVSEQPDGAGTSAATSFEVDARIGHAWFARSGTPKAEAEPGPVMLPALRKAELILAKQGRAIARRATRVPAEAIVKLGAALSPSNLKRPAKRPIASSEDLAANDNSGSQTKTILREIAFLVLFCATLAGTYFLGRSHATHNVISVPDPVTRSHKVVEYPLQGAKAR